MRLKRRARILAAGKSPSLMAMKRTYNRAILNGGVTQDFSANVENIREISRKLGYNILKTTIPNQTNLLLYSEELEKDSWSLTNGSVTVNNTIAPNGMLTADAILDNVTNGGHHISQGIFLFSGTNYTYSFYIKKADFDWFQFVVNGTFSTTMWFNFNLTTGLFGNTGAAPFTYTVSDEGDGWWRFKIVITPTVSGQFTLGSLISTNNTNTLTRVPSYVGVGSKIFYTWGHQYEYGSTASTYVQTTNLGDFTNANFLYVPSSYGESKNFAQVQNKRNLLIRTEEFDNTFWFKDATTLTANSTTAPNGTNTADALFETTANASHSIFDNLNGTISTVNGAIYTFSVYVKANGRNFVRFGFNSAYYGSSNTVFDLSTGSITIQTGVNNATISDVGNGWFRISVTDTATTTTTNLGICVVSTMLNSTTLNYVGDITKGIYIWGAQLELGAYATPYQKTVVAGDGIVDFNFTRATASTVTNKLGVIEDSCYNLLQRSEEFDNAYWVKTNNTITANTVPAGVDPPQYKILLLVLV